MWKNILKPCFVIAALAMLFLVLPISANAEEYNNLNTLSPTQEEISAFIKAKFPGNIYGSTPGYTVNPVFTAPYNLGKPTDKTLKEGLNAVNTMRYIAGLNADVKLDEDYNKFAQGASLINEINGSLSHFPLKPKGMSDELYNICYNGASKSNIGMGYNNLVHSVVNGYMMDQDSSNIDRVGHRRWILNPPMQNVGFGIANRCSAMYAFDTRGSGSVSGQEIVAWPARNTPVEYFDQAAPFSLSLGNMYDELNRDAITIQMVRQRDGKSWCFDRSTSMSPYSMEYFNVNNAWYGQPRCLIWRPPVSAFGNDYSSEDSFTITITGITKGKTPYPIRYTVNFFGYQYPNAAKYTIHFNGNGGTGTMTDMAMIYGTTKNLSANRFTRTGYNFMGWSTSPTGNVTYTNNQSVNKLTSKNGSTVTLYAHWTPINYTIKFNSSGGSGTMPNLSMTYNTQKSLPTNKFTRTGYTFTGWAKSSSGSVTYKNKQIIKNLTSKNNTTITLYAKWSKLTTYTIKFKSNGGRGTMPNLSMVYNTQKSLPTNRFTRKGYQFTGWSKTPKGAIIYKNKQKIKNLTTKNKATITLHAKWKPKNNKILSS